VLYMAWFEIRSTRDHEDDLLYQLNVIPIDIKADADEDDGLAELVTLKVNIGGGDNGEPVLTIMKPEED